MDLKPKTYQGFPKKQKEWKDPLVVDDKHPEKKEGCVYTLAEKVGRQCGFGDYREELAIQPIGTPREFPPLFHSSQEACNWKFKRPFSEAFGLVVVRLNLQEGRR